MDNSETLMSLTAAIVVAHVSNNHLSQSELPHLVTAVHGALSAISKPASEENEPPQQPAVPVRSSIKPDHLVCLEDGKKLTMLKRHLMVHFGLTPDDYRQKWKLPSDYPMVAPNYAKRRREIAIEVGLGNTGRGGKPKAADPATQTPSE